jgi:hypothetical protein
MGAPVIVMVYPPSVLSPQPSGDDRSQSEPRGCNPSDDSIVITGGLNEKRSALLACRYTRARGNTQTETVLFLTLR